MSTCENVLLYSFHVPDWYDRTFSCVFLHHWLGCGSVAPVFHGSPVHWGWTSKRYWMFVFCISRYTLNCLGCLRTSSIVEIKCALFLMWYWRCGGSFTSRMFLSWFCSVQIDLLYFSIRAFGSIKCYCFGGIWWPLFSFCSAYLIWIKICWISQYLFWRKYVFDALG